MSKYTSEEFFAGCTVIKVSKWIDDDYTEIAVAIDDKEAGSRLGQLVNLLIRKFAEEKDEAIRKLLDDFLRTALKQDYSRFVEFLELRNDKMQKTFKD